MNNHKQVKDMLKNFYPFAKKRFGFDKPAKIILNPDQENSQKPLGKTAFYDPQNYSVTVYTHSRHPKDIMRSISHELVHHTQNCRGDLTSVAGEQGQGYAQNNEHLREMEREAYEQGNLCFRDWEDGIKSNLEPGTIYEKRSTTTMGTVKDHLKRRDAMRVQKLFEKFGYTAPVREEEDDGEFAHLGIKTTEDRFGPLHILPGVEFTGDIASDIKQIQQNDELDSWLYGDLGSDEAITDAAGKITYSGADVQDIVGAEEDYDGSYQPRMSDDERREMYDNESLSDYDDIYEGSCGKGKREDEKDELSSKQSDEMDKDKDGDIDGEDLKALRKNENEKKHDDGDGKDEKCDYVDCEDDKEEKNENLTEALKAVFTKNPKLINVLKESGLSNKQIIKKVLEYGDHETQARGGMVSSTYSSDPEMDQIEDIAAQQKDWGLLSISKALKEQGFDVTLTNAVLVIDNKYFMGKPEKFDISPDEEVREIEGSPLVLGRMGGQMEEGMGGESGEGWDDLLSQIMNASPDADAAEMAEKAYDLVEAGNIDGATDLIADIINSSSDPDTSETAEKAYDAVEALMKQEAVNNVIDGEKAEKMWASVVDNTPMRREGAIEADKLIAAVAEENPDSSPEEIQAFLDALVQQKSIRRNSDEDFGDEYQMMSEGESRHNTPDFFDSDEEKEMMKKMSNKEFYNYVTRDRHVVPDLKGDMGPMDGMEGPFQFKSGAVLYYDPKAGKYYDRGKDMYLDNEEASRLTMEQEEQEDQAGSSDEVAAAKEKGMKSDVQKVAKFMFNHKQLGPALEKLKGDNVEVAQLLALLSQEMGVDPSDLGTLVTKVKGAMKEAEGDVFEVGDKVVDDRNGQTGTVTEPMAGGAVIKLDDGEIVKVRDKFLSKVEPTVMKEFGEEDEEATTYSDLTPEQIDMLAASLSEEKTECPNGCNCNEKEEVEEAKAKVQEMYDDDPYEDEDPYMAGLEAEFPWMKDKKKGKRASAEDDAAMAAAMADAAGEYAMPPEDEEEDEFADPLQEWWNIRNDRKASKFFEWAVKNK